jgi:hypothetical protein
MARAVLHRSEPVTLVNHCGAEHGILEHANALLNVSD